MHCLKCAAEIEEGKFYCEKCGSSIQLVPDYSPLEDYLQNKIAEKPQQSTTLQPKPESGKRKKKKVRKNKKQLVFWSVITVLLVIAALVGVIVVYFANDYDYQIKRAKEYIRQEEYQPAIRCLENILNLKQEETELLVYLGESYIGLGEDKKGVSYLKKAIAQDHENIEAYGGLLEYYEAEDEMETIGILMEKAPDAIRTEFPEYIADQPVVLKQEGIYNRAFSAEISFGKGTVYYTLNNTSPVVAVSDVYTEPILITEEETIIRAVFVNNKGVISSETVCRYGIVQN